MCRNECVVLIFQSLYLGERISYTLEFQFNLEVLTRVEWFVINTPVPNHFFGSSSSYTLQLGAKDTKNSEWNKFARENETASKRRIYVLAIGNN